MVRYTLSIIFWLVLTPTGDHVLMQCSWLKWFHYLFIVFGTMLCIWLGSVQLFVTLAKKERLFTTLNAGFWISKDCLLIWEIYEWSSINVNFLEGLPGVIYLEKIFKICNYLWLAHCQWGSITDSPSPMWCCIVSNHRCPLNIIFFSEYMSRNHGGDP